MYDQIKEKLKPFKGVYTVVKFLITPYRFIREKSIRRKLVNKAVEEYSTFDRSRQTIFYLGIPEHNNLGDIAQTFCTCRWINDNFHEANLLKVRTKATHDKKFIEFLSHSIRPNDIVIFQSGYCSRYKNPDHIMHKHIASCFPNARLVILPQTVKLLNQKDVLETKDIFSKCENLTFICRDKQSFESAKAFTTESQRELFPDIVTSLIGKFPVHQSKRSGALICVRNDDEKFYSDEEIKILRNKLIPVFGKVDIRDTNSNYSVQYTYDHLEEVIREMANDFAQYEVIITDRYHGTIFSLVANTPVVVIKTNDHKVVSAVAWFDGRFEPYAVQLSESIEQAYEMALDVHKIGVELCNKPIFFNEYYETKLFDVIRLLNE